MLTKHHRKSKANKGDSSPHNISLVPENQHQAFHVLWDGTKTANDICDDLNKRWIDPDCLFICVPRKQCRKILKTLQQLT